MLLVFVFVVIICTTTNAQVTCPAGFDCTVDCSDASTTCGSSKTIDATAATSLTVFCNEDFACDYSEIYIPNATDATTTIECSGGTSGYRSCMSTKVYYLGDATATSSTHSLNIICSNVNSPCDAMKIYATNAGQFKFQCDAAECYSLDIYVENVDIVTLQCDASSSSSYHGCRSTDLFATNANIVNISCTGDIGCYHSNIDAANADKLYVFASENGIFSGEYHGENIGSIYDITCIGDGTSNPGCTSQSKFYIPQNDVDLSKFTLSCYGTGCYNIRLYKTTGGFSAIGDANINWNGCLQCPGDIEDCYQYIYTYCGASTYDYFPYGSNGDCGTTLDCADCPLVQSAFYDAYIDDTSDANCVLPTGTISCAANSACVIDCSTEACAGNIIDGTQATSLTVSCSTVDSCKDIILYPTTKASSSTHLNCGSEGRTTRYESGCNGFTIHGNDAYTLTVTASPYGINGGSIYTQSIANAFTLTCVGNGTEPGYSSYKRHACDGPLALYLPETASDLSKFTLNCYGTGCGDIYFYNDNGFADITGADINFNGCLQCEDSSYPDRDAGYNCLGTIRTYCGSSYDTFGTSSSDGFDCGTSPLCSCDVVANAFESSYTDDTSDSQCILGASAVQCAADEDCAVDCDTASCADGIIDASLASGLIMQCATAEICKDAIVALPNDITSTTRITCSALDACNGLRLSFAGDASSASTEHSIYLECNTVDDACDGVIINADKAGTVEFVCDGVECGDTTINANNAGIVNVSCDGGSTTEDGYHYGCNMMIINATDVSTSVDVSCSGKNGCYNTKLYANRAASITLDLNGDVSGNNYFYGPHADRFEITCYAGFDSQDDEYSGCTNAKFYVPDDITSDNFRLNCYGKGCDAMDIYSKNGFTTATTANFYVNGCTDCLLNTVDIGDNAYCADALGIGCIDNSYSATQYVSDDFDGYSCTNAQYDCGCAQVATILNSVFTEEPPADDDRCSSSLFAYEYDPPEEKSATGTVIILIIVLLGLCFAAGLLRKCWLKNEWEKRKKVKDDLAKQIEAGDATKQSEYDDICVSTPDEFVEPELKHWTDYMLWYALDPFFSLFYDRWDKYFAYIGWAGEAIEVIVTLWIIFSLMSPKAAFACCSYSRENAKCDPYQAMGEDLDLVEVDENGWCVVDESPCVRSYYYDADDTSAMFECFNADRIELAQQWNDEICGKEARKEAVQASSTWIVVVLLFKLIKIGWDYYITILQFMEKKRVAKENIAIVAQYREKHPDWKPNTEKEAQYKDEKEQKTDDPHDDKNGDEDKIEKDDETAKKPDDDKKEQLTNEGGTEKETEAVPKDNEAVQAEQKENENEDDDALGPQLVSEEAIKVCGFISTEDEHWKKYYPYCVLIMFFLGSTLSVAVLAGLDATGGISIAECSYDDAYDYDNACYNVGRCAYAGTQDSSTTTSSSGGSQPVYAIVNNNVQLEGPQILAIFATVIAYIAYVPMIREKVTKYMVLKGFKEGETEADELLDLEAFNGIF